MQNKVEYRMAIPSVTREYTPGFCLNSRNPMRHPPRREMRLDLLHCVQSNPVFPMKHVMSFNLLDGTAKSPEEHCHKTRRTLMSPQECKIARCTPNQLEMKPISPSLAPYLSRVPHHTEQVAGLPFGNYRDCLRHPSQVYMNNNFSTANRGKPHASHIVSR